MELDLGLKISRDADHQSSTDFHIAKDRAGPVFVSTETDSVFILSAHLKGFEKENIKININEDGTMMNISGEKLVSETIMSGWRLYKTEGEVNVFRKAFKIPDGVVLDKIRAKFGEENFSLTVYMPKSEKGILGHGIAEVKREEEDGHEKQELKKPAEKKQEDEKLEKVKKQPPETEAGSSAKKSPEIKKPDLDAKPDADVHGAASKQRLTPGDEGGVHEHENGEASKNQKESAENSIQKEGEGAVVEKKPAFFAPRFFMGSALIASLVVLVVGWVRTNPAKKQ